MPATVPVRPDDFPMPPGLAEAVFRASPTATMLLRARYGADGQEIIDLDWAWLNPAAQQLLRLPEHPAGSFRTLFPAAASAGVFGRYCEAFRAGHLEPGPHRYQHDGLDGYSVLVAQRHDDLLVVYLAADHDPPSPAGEQARRQSPVREQPARPPADAQRATLQAIINQAPVAIGLFEGAELRITAANHLLSAMWGRTPAEVVGFPLLQAVPELAGQGFEEQVRQVAADRLPYIGHEVPAQVLRDGRLATTYYNFVFQPLYNDQGGMLGIMAVVVEMTDQVLARQQVQLLNEELAAMNEELRASNEEYLLANAALSETQQQWQQLSEELEQRVAARSGEVRAALHAAEQQREQLREQQSMLRQILGQVPAFIATLSGPEHRFSFFNDAYYRLTAGRAHLGRPAALALPEAAEQGFIALLDQVYTSGEPYIGKEIVILLDQPAGPPTQHYLDFTYQPLTDAHGQPQGILAFILDVTEQVRVRRQADTLQTAMLAATQRQAQQRQELYQIVSQAPVAVVLLREPDHRIDYYNAAFEELFPPEEWAGSLQGHVLSEVYPRMKVAGLVELLDRVYASGEPQVLRDLPLATLHPGSPRYLTLSYQAYREQDRIVGVAAFAYDVTEQVLARQQVEGNARQLRLLTDALPVLIGYLDREERYRFNNQAYVAWFDQKPESLYGRPVREVVGEAAYRGVKQYIERALAGERLDFESRMPYREDFVKYIRTSYVPDVQQGQVVGFYTLVTDVTEQVLARQQVQRANEELAATNQALNDTNTRLTRTNADLDTFVYSASHDLKSPITNIEGLLLALRQQLPPEALQAELVEQLLGMMDGAVARFQQTLGHLTDVTRLQEALFNQPAESVNLPALVEAVRLDILPELTAAGATLRLDLHGCTTVYCSPKILRSILYNLLSNAIKYRAPDRPALVQLRGRQTEAGQLVLEVADNGLGLDERQQGQLFQLFRRLHTHVPGSGVGLYMVKKMVDSAGGLLALDSQPGVGSTFTVTLPAPKRQP